MRTVSGQAEFFACRACGRKFGGAAEYVVIPVLARLLVSLVLFGIFVALFGKNPLDLYFYMYQGAFGTWFSWQNTLTRAAPLILTALCTALPAQLGMVIIGGEGALVIGALAATGAALALPGAPPLVVEVAMACAGMIGGGLWIMLSGALRHYRGVNETISSLLLVYIAIALLNFLVEGPMRDPASLNKPSTHEIGAANMIGNIPGTDVHWGLVFGIVAAVLSYILIYHTVFGFAARVAGGNIRAAKVVGLSVGKLILIICFLAGAAAGLAGMIEVAAVQGRANANLAAGYGFAGILVAFLARQNPLAIIPVAILLGGIGASGGLLQRRLGLAGRLGAGAARHDLRHGAGERHALRPLELLQAKGILEWPAPATSACGRCRSRCSAARCASRTPFLFVSLGECITERSGRINLGLEGTLVMGAMSGYGVSYLTGSPWLGVLAAGIGVGMGALACRDLQPAAGQRHRRRHRLDAVRHRARLLSRQAAHPADGAAAAVDRPRLVERYSASARRAAHQCAVPDRRRAGAGPGLGAAHHALGPDPAHRRRKRRCGAGDGLFGQLIRLRATMVGGFLAGIGGSFLSLYYPGSWNEGLSSGQGIMAVALVIFARWNPMLCLCASLLFGGAGALGPALQSVGIPTAIICSTPRPTS